ncbi:hypothetical protein [Pseudomonas syringae]|uniref:Phosphatidylinositol diacylglycerol-lyase n=1 Tax=Pseudomonas syringae TaxID=317 RepID=A0A085V7I8_PSESX|nr:hypothetical protein [Pseudomonas syringae]KFE51401.1 hypothetical protein IV01_24440 [Pseudomonas syringae]
MTSTATPKHYNWMALTPQIGTLRIDELILAGTHNAGMDKQSPNMSLPQEITQDVSPLEQIQNGIRVLDLRVSYYEKYPPGDPRRFQIYHATSSGRTIAIDILGALLGFYSKLEQSGDKAREIVILDFHMFKNFTDEAHHQLVRQIIHSLGERIIQHDLRFLTLGELWAQHPGKNVVIAYDDPMTHWKFWDGVDQCWSGENLISTSNLKLFMDEVAEGRKPDYQLQSIQCAKYVLPFHVPDDFSEKINEWFKSESARSYIQNFHIINTDWALRSNIVEDCIHANIIRAGLRQRCPFNRE